MLSAHGKVWSLQVQDYGATGLRRGPCKGLGRGRNQPDGEDGEQCSRQREWQEQRQGDQKALESGRKEVCGWIP